MKKSAGFTSVELLIVVAIVGVLTAATLPDLISWYPEHRLKSSARDLVSKLQKARVTAVKTNTAVTLRLDASTSPGFYYLDTDGSGSYTAGEDRVNLSDYKSGVDYGYGGAAANWNNANCTQSTVITFSTKGTASSSGAVYLENANNDVCFGVEVLSTGVIKLRKYDNGAWG